MTNIFSPLFLLSFVAYVIFLMGEEIAPGFVSNYFNPHLLLIPAIILLVLMLWREKKVPLEEPRKVTGGGLLIFLAGFITLSILWVGAYQLPTFWRTLVTIYGGLLTIGIINVLFKE